MMKRSISDEFVTDKPKRSNNTMEPSKKLDQCATKNTRREQAKIRSQSIVQSLKQKSVQNAKVIADDHQKMMKSTTVPMITLQRSVLHPRTLNLHEKGASCSCSQTSII